MPGGNVPVSMGSTVSNTVDLPGLRVSEVRFPPGARLPGHTHDRPIFATAIAGSLDSRLPGRTLDCDVSTVWTEPAEETHANRVGSGGARVVAILPDPANEDLLRHCGDLLDSMHHWRHAGVASLARQIIPELHQPDSASQLSLQGLALEALAIGLRSGLAAESPSTMPPWLRRARDVIHDRFRESLSISQIAEEVDVEPARLAREFRSEFRLPIGKYQRTLRLDFAAAELATGDLALSTLALRTGFYDQAHFTRHFRAHTGETPGAYRKARQGRSGPAADRSVAAER